MSDVGPPVDAGAGSEPRPETDRSLELAALDGVAHCRSEGIVQNLLALDRLAGLGDDETLWLFNSWNVTRVLRADPFDAAGLPRPRSAGA